MAKPLKVIDFNAKKFDEFLNQIFKNEQFKADNVLILGIEDGGKPLAQLTFEFLSNHFENSDFHLKFVKSQRPSTKVKKENLLWKSTLKSIFRILPKRFLNYLRLQEHRFLMKNHNLEREIHFTNSIPWQRYSQIWIIDDAVDTGRTLEAVLNSIKMEVNDCLKIKTLVVTTTSNQAKIKPDFSLYHQVLVRFPWSLDG